MDVDKKSLKEQEQTKQYNKMDKFLDYLMRIAKILLYLSLAFFVSVCSYFHFQNGGIIKIWNDGIVDDVPPSLDDFSNEFDDCFK